MSSGGGILNSNTNTSKGKANASNGIGGNAIGGINATGKCIDNGITFNAMDNGIGGGSGINNAIGMSVNGINNSIDGNGSGIGGVSNGVGGSNSQSPCGACKFLRRRCERGCIFAPYFGAEQQGRFEAVHRVFGASNVSKMLQRIPLPELRREAIFTITFEAQARMSDPIYGCVAYILALQQQVASLQAELTIVQSQLGTYMETMHRQHQQMQLQQHCTISPQNSSSSYNAPISILSSPCYSNFQSQRTIKDESFNGSFNYDIAISQCLQTLSSTHQTINNLSRTKYYIPFNEQLHKEPQLDATELQALAQDLLHRN